MIRQMKWTSYLIFIIFFLTISCQKDDKENEVENEIFYPKCNDYIKVYSTEIIDYYKDTSMIIDDKYDDECLSIKGTIGLIILTDSFAVIQMNNFQVHSESSSISCKFSEEFHTPYNNDILKQYTSGGFTSLKGRYNSNPEKPDLPPGSFYKEYNFIVEEILPDPFSFDNECGIVGKPWICDYYYDDACFSIYNWFVPSDIENLLYVSHKRFLDEDEVALETMVYRYDINNNCDSISISELDMSNTYHYTMEVVRDSLTLTNQDGEVTLLVK